MANGGIIGPVNDPTSTTVVTTFTASGTLNSPNQAPNTATVLVVAGGGAGAVGGGGAGGFREVSCVSVSGPAPVVVGAGGSLGNSPACAGYPGK